MDFQKYQEIEYAKLIAKQFPIYNEKGILIDYSNISDFQLELLTLHEEYGEEKDSEKKLRIFNKLLNMNEEEWNRRRQIISPKQKTDLNTTSSTNNNEGTLNPNQQQKKKYDIPRTNYGPNVGKDGGNPDYKKTVIQLEKERYEREKQELLMKRKRNSNYI